MTRDRDHSLPFNPLLRELLGGRADQSAPVHWNTRGAWHFRDRTGSPARSRVQWTDLAERCARLGWDDYWAEWRTHLRARRVVVEHTSINPVHPLHLGALRSTLIGGSLARVLRSAGADVKVHYFVNDHGRQVVLLDWILARTDRAAVPPGLRFDLAAGVLYALVNMLLGDRREDVARLTAAHPWLDAAVPSAARDTAALRARLTDPADPEAGFVDGMVDLTLHDMALVGAHVDVLERESQVAGPLEPLLLGLLGEHETVSVNGTWCLRRPDGLVPLARANGSSLYFLRDVANALGRGPGNDLMFHVIGDDQSLLQRALRELLDRRGLASEHVAFGTITDGGRKFSSRQNRLVTVEQVHARGAGRLDAVALDMMLRRPSRSVDIAAFDGLAHQRVTRALELARQGRGVTRSRSAASRPAARALLFHLLRGLGAVHGALHRRSPHPLARYLVDLSADYARAARAEAVTPWAQEWFLATHAHLTDLLGLDTADPLPSRDRARAA
ncbi:arginine--tRNA ligase [Kitasatospora xanthocidica]|uniref:Arginine--tRNA ligase n=1 Tax=Kitasatospora xanthocidica TaxID=83382 RepID=A0A372ZNR2_9ACTN|nr:arginine--tRNA ligase [Kitasatospora xanthocidica]RGD57496.1 arginine--tRNA ligase [Kitasatospora xanthocidica]